MNPTPTPTPTPTATPAPDVLGAVVHLSAQADVLTTAVVVFGFMVVLLLGFLVVKAVW